MTARARRVRGTGSLVQRLRRWLAGSDGAGFSPPVDAGPIAPQPPTFEGPTGEPGLVALQSSMSALEKQINRAGREQLKTNALLEAQMAELHTALEALRTADTRREVEFTGLREQQHTQQVTARLDLARTLLPVMDGLDEALRSGRQLLEQATPPPPSPSLIDRLRGKSPAPPVTSALHEGMQAWLRGLGFVQERLLQVLAEEDVSPIAVEGQPFDPQRHLAVEVVPAGDQFPAGTVVAAVRRGYLAGERLLRQAEVVVAKGNE